MTLTPAADPFHPRVTDLAHGLLEAFQAAGVLAAADVHVATGLGRLSGEADERVLLAAALAVRAARLGSVCLDVPAAAEQIVPEEPLDAAPPAPASAGDATDAGDGAAPGGDADAGAIAVLPWPELPGWLEALRTSRLVDPGPDRLGGRPLQLAGSLLYLDRYWRQEELVAGELIARDRRSTGSPPAVDEPALLAGLERLFPPRGEGPDLQRLAAEVAARRWLTVLAGGPGTGKTTTVARILALLMDQPGPRPHSALAAPTGKAATRLEEAVHEAVRELPERDRERLQGLGASTLHRLLGSFGSGSRFRHHAGNRLPHDVIVVDESSMISLTMMARLLDAVRPDARLVLVGDPEQLASVDAGAVLGDIVDAAGASPVASGIVVLDRSWRFEGRIAELARAVQAGDVDRVLELLHTPSADLSYLPHDVLTLPAASGGGALGVLRDDVVEAARGLVGAAKASDADEAIRQLGRHRLLCAHRSGPYGVDRWSPELERWIDAALSGYRGAGEWYPGRPLLVTANDYDVNLFNGDTGVIISDGGGGVTAAFNGPSGAVRIRPARIGSVQTMQAMTVHRSQGSQFDRVSVLLPAEGSALLTRQLLYTAVTRARHHVRVIGTEEAVRAAVATPITRASGLRDRLGA